MSQSQSQSFYEMDLKKVSEVFPQYEKSVAQLEQIQKHKYANRQIAVSALFHSSALVHWPKDKSGLCSNETLEFLGDSFLNFTVTSELIRLYPKFKEGELSKLRAAIVGTDNLIQHAQHLQLGECLILGKGDLTRARASKHSFLADAFEAVVAALYLDAGEERARTWVLEVLEADMKDGSNTLARVDAKSRFQEWLQAIVNVTPEYRLIDETPQGNETIFTMGCFLFESEIARASGKNKKEASRLVAEMLMSQVSTGEFTEVEVKKLAEAK